MKKGLIIGSIFGVVILLIFALGYFQLTGSVVGGHPEGMEGDDGYGGPSVADSECLYQCVEIEGKAESVCMSECGVAPKPTDVSGNEACMQECIMVGCDKYDVECQNSNVDSCEQECDIIGEPEAESEEEQCIRDCINKIDPYITCSSGSFEGEGETGNEVCQKCAKSCEHLYSGPCLGDEEWTEKENVCYAQCEHCYGEPVRGTSGQGWDCTIDIKCVDASAEFGDDAGTGENSWEEGHAPNEDNVYWGDYKSDLELSDSEGVLEIRNTNIKNIGKKVKVNINGGEGVSLKEKDEKLIVKNEEVEVEIDNNLDKLVISEKGNKREIKEIEIEIEEGKPVYRYEEKEKARLLGFVPVSKGVEKRVDAEKMDVLEENGPWWEFLSVEEKEKILEK